MTSFYDALKARRGEIEQRYHDLTPASGRLAQEARRVLPGGSTRDTVMRRPHPTYIRRGDGGHLVDADGRTIVDLWFNATSLPLGHADPRVVRAARAALEGGSAFFAPTGAESDLAREICARLPSADRVRFTNSGTEAVMLAVRMSRAYTGRAIVAKFEGSYHGAYDDVQWSVSTPGVGSVEAPAPVAASAGLLRPDGRVLVLPYNDLDATSRLLGGQANEVAAVIVEPIANRMGMVSPKPGFLAGLREVTARYRIVLIFDEVISFRLDYHGAQGLAGVMPDLTTLGKVIGGGFPVGAVAGRAEILDVSAPDRPTRVAHAGTFTANPVTMAAGRATLEALTPAVFADLNATGERVRQALRRVAEGLPLRVKGAGSLFKISASAAELVDHRSSMRCDASWEELASLALLNEGFFLTTRLHGCVSTATRAGDLDRFVDAFGAIVRA
jgi:glutamate-1-semialdehyde 2,1-aminomutase